MNLVLTARLKRVYWPEEVLGHYTLKKVLAVPPCDFIDESLRETIGGDEYDFGRVHHFYNLLKSGMRIDPIDIKTTARQYRAGSPISWGGPIIFDGHHRFVAAVLAKQKRVPVEFSGLVSTLDWLTGKRRTPPTEIFG